MVAIWVYFGCNSPLAIFATHEDIFGTTKSYG
jgi:hypothetical protein